MGIFNLSIFYFRGTIQISKMLKKIPGTIGSIGGNFCKVTPFGKKENVFV